MSAKRRKTFKKAYLNLLWLVAAALAAAVLYFYPPARAALGLDAEKAGSASAAVKIDAEGGLTVHFIDVGQGDSELIIAPDGTAMLIDAGPNDAEDTLKAYLDAQGVKALRYVVFTHPHEDHIGGGDMVMKNYTVQTVIMSASTSTASTFERLLDAVDGSGAQVVCANDSVGQTYTLGDSTAAPEFTILAPLSDTYDDLNDTSVVLRLDYGGMAFMFTGDACEQSESDQLAKYSAGELRCDVLKVGHHGSKSSTSQAYLDAVSPSIAVISCAKINDYGHPHSETLKKLRNAGVKTYGTYDLGTIVIRTDGKNIEVIGK